MNELLRKKISLVSFPDNQYYKEVTEKNQIVLHHTVSPGHSASGDIQWWLSTKERIATHVIITQDGNIHQCFNSKYWGHHLGITSKQFADRNLPDINLQLNKASYSIELDSLGPVTADGQSIAYENIKASAGVVDYGEAGYRGHRYYEKYTDAQIESARLLILHIACAYGINTEYCSDMWDISNDALTGKNGIWSHTSFRTDKSDCHPQPELIQMLNSL